MKDKVDLSQIKVVAYTDYFPNWPMFAMSKLNKNTAAKIQAALLKLKPNNPDSERVLSAAKLAGFAPITDKDYDQLRMAAKLVGAL
jgi:phosphonate transport system substrate-binding protein